MRLIDADKLLKDGIRVEYGYNDNGLILVPMRDVRKSIENAPTVDSDCLKEYAEEIFWELDKLLTILKDDEDGRDFVTFDFIEYINLKKKYTEGRIMGKQMLLYAARDPKTGKLVSDITNPRKKFWQKKEAAAEAICNATSGRYRRYESLELVTFKLVEVKDDEILHQ